MYQDFRKKNEKLQNNTDYQNHTNFSKVGLQSAFFLILCQESLKKELDPQKRQSSTKQFQRLKDSKTFDRNGHSFELNNKINPKMGKATQEKQVNDLIK